MVDRKIFEKYRQKRSNLHAKCLPTCNKLLEALIGRQFLQACLNGTTVGHSITSEERDEFKTESACSSVRLSVPDQIGSTLGCTTGDIERKREGWRSDSPVLVPGPLVEFAVAAAAERKKVSSSGDRRTKHPN